MKYELELPRFWFAMLALLLLAFIAVAPPAAAQATSQTQANPQTQPQPACPPPSTSTDKSATTAAASTVTKAANSISNLGSIFGKKKVAQDADKTANVAGGCDATVNNAATAAGAVAGTASVAASGPKSSSTEPAAAPAPTPSSSAATQPANIPVATQPQAASAPYTPPSGAPAAPAGPLDPSKLPDISGLHLGITMPDAKAVLQKIYPGLRIDAMGGSAMGPQHQVFTGLFRVQGNNDAAAVDFTMPPNPQVVWHMTRAVPQPHVAHNVLVAALRQKYGKEAVAIGNASRLSSNDSDIVQMWWVFDERGQTVPEVKLINSSPFGCGGGAFMGATGGSPHFYDGLMSSDTGGLSSYCAGTYVGVIAAMSNQAILDSVTLDIVDLPLAVRSAKATDAWSKAESDKARQQEIQKSNQVKPAL